VVVVVCGLSGLWRHVQCPWVVVVVCGLSFRECEVFELIPRG